MESCPHGSRITVEDGRPVVFLEPCAPCEELLADLPVQSALPAPREFAHA